MNTAGQFVEPRGSDVVRYGGIALAVLVIAFLGWFLFRSLFDVRGVPLSVAPPVLITMMPPVEPPKIEPKVEPKIEPKPVEVPTEQPKSAAPSKADAPAPMTMNAAGEAGSDSFGLTAGSGTGSGSPGGAGTCTIPPCGTGKGGGGFGDGLYSGYLRSVLEQRIQENKKVNRMSFTAEFAIVVDRSGRVTNALLVRSTGDQDRDALLRDALENVRGLNAPPDSLRFPQKITVRGRR